MKFKLLLLIYFSLLSISQAQLVKFEPIRNYHKSGRSVFDDVMSHSSNNTNFGSISTTAHENTHVASNCVYLKENGGQTYVYFYVLDNWGFKIKEPKSFTLSQLAKKIPEKYRGEIYQLYMVKACSQFEHEPSNMLDEWNAYTIGTMAAIEGKETEFDTQDTGWRMLEMGIYSLYLNKMAQQEDIKQFVNLESKRNLFICTKVKMSEHMKKNLNNFKMVMEEFK